MALFALMLQVALSSWHAHVGFAVDAAAAAVFALEDQQSIQPLQGGGVLAGREQENDHDHDSNGQGEACQLCQALQSPGQALLARAGDITPPRLLPGHHLKPEASASRCGCAGAHGFKAREPPVV